MCHLVTISKLVNSCCRISTTDDCYSICVGKCFCDCLCSISEFWHLEASHWSVPYNCLRRFNSISEHLSCLRSDIKTHPSVRDLVLSYNFCICIVRESICCNSIYWKKKFNTFLLCFLNHVKCIL